MIIYENARYFGWSIFLHMTGSALFSIRSLLPAFISASVAALLSNYDPIRAWLASTVVYPSMTTLGLEFLITLVLVNRIQIANMRFRAAHELYGQFHYSLLRTALLFTSCLDECPNQKVYPQQLASLRAKFLRWITAIHTLALEEYQGFENPTHRMGVLLFTEEIILFKENRKAARMIRWLSRAYHQNKWLISPGTAIDGKMMALLDEVLANYGQTLVCSNRIYPFPHAQTSLFCVVAYAFWAPLFFASLMPASYFLAPLFCFASVWIAFGLCVSAQLMEWPFDGKANDLPFTYFGIRFFKEIAEIEFGRDANLVSLDLQILLGEPPEEDVDYVIPVQRPLLGARRRETRQWLELAVRDLDNKAKTRKRLRNHLRPTTATANGTGNTMSEIRASGKFKVLI